MKSAPLRVVPQIQPMDMTERLKNSLTGMNLNSILMFVVLAVLGWLGMETRSTSLGLAEVRTAQTLISKSNTDSFTRIEEHLNNAVPRREFDMRIVAVETALAEIRLRLHELDMQISKRR